MVHGGMDHMQARQEDPLHRLRRLCIGFCAHMEAGDSGDSGTTPGAPTEGSPDRAEETHDAAVLEDDRRLVCKLCRSPVTRERERIAVAGSHSHVFFNPHGLIFEIGCFAQADGAAAIGRLSEDFSWFTACAWQVALCRTCQTHLGWRFSGQSLFWGLILDQLAGE